MSDKKRKKRKKTGIQKDMPHILSGTFDHDSLWKKKPEPIKHHRDRPGWKMPEQPQTDEQLIQQIDMMRSFLGSVIKCIKTKEHDTAYVLMDRVAELSNNCRTAMEDIEP